MYRKTTTNMTRRFLSAALLVAAAHAVPTLPTPSSIIFAMNSAAQYYQAHNGLAGDCGWTRGTYFAGSMAHYNVTGNATLVKIATAWAANHS